MADGRTLSVHDVFFEVLCQSMPIDDDFCVVTDLSSIDRYQLIPVSQFYRLIDWFSDHRFPSIGYPGNKGSFAHRDPRFSLKTECSEVNK